MKNKIKKIAKRTKFVWIIGVVRTYVMLVLNSTKSNRKLEIGPGSQRLQGFETLDITPHSYVDYLCNAARRLPFGDNTFELIYASHILEHIPWYNVEKVLTDWMRTLKQGGRLEIWVPDGLKICKALVDYELYGKNYINKDGFDLFNPEKDPCKWAAGRIFTYGDGKGNLRHPNWHRAMFTPRYLKQLFEKTGLTDIEQLDSKDVRGFDHGWINLGMRGVKP